MLLFMASRIFMEDALPYLQVGRQDQEDRWDRHYPKQLENNIFCIKIWRCYLIYFDQYHYQHVCTETQMLSKWKQLYNGSMLLHTTFWSDILTSHYFVMMWDISNLFLIIFPPI